MNDELHSEKTIHRKLFLFVLGFSVFSVWLITVTFQLSLIDIAHTFQVNVGTAGLVAAVGSISGAVAGLLMSVLSVRLNHKLLLLIGLACTSLAAVGFFLAPTFSFVLVPNIGVGAGIAIVTSMAYSLIGEFYPLEKRGRAIGCIVASSTLVYVIGGPIIGILTSIGGWRSTMIWLSLPTSLTCLILAFLIIPHKSKTNPIIQKEPFFSGCKQVFLNRSAMAILFVTMFSMAEGSIGFYAVSYFRSQFLITIEMGSLVMLVGNVLGAVGGVVSGLLVNKVGRKPLGTLSCLAAALVTLTFTFMPTFELSWGFTVIRFWFSAMAFTAGGSLVIEQLPKFRGTMMSLNSTFMNFGMLLASVSAEIVLNLYNYQAMAVVLGGFGLVGTIIWVSLVRDPCKDEKN